MTLRAIKEAIASLPADQRHELLEDLLRMERAESVPEQLPAWQESLLKERRKAYEQSPSEGVTLDDFKAKIQSTIERFEKRQSGKSA